MNKDDKLITIKIIDGEEFLFPSIEGWKVLDKEPVIDGIEIYYEKMIKVRLETVWKYKELSMGVIKYPGLDKWTPMCFIEINNYLQRCHLERLTCKTCGWQGITAYPLDRTLYPLKGAEKLMKKAYDLGKKPCPQCGGELPRYPIWVEPLSPPQAQKKYISI